MRLTHVPALQGAQWLKRGIAVFARAPLAFSWLLMAFVLIGLLVAGLLPVIGLLLVLASPPLLSLGFMIATRRLADGGTAPGFSVFVEPFRVPRRQLVALIQLCVAYAVLLALIVWLSDVISGGKLLVAPGSGTVDVEQLMARVRDSDINRALLIGTTLVMLLSVPFWHAPALVHWAQQGVGQALFSSTLACWRNRGALGVYGLALIGLNVVVSWLATLPALLLDSMPVAMFAGLIGSVALWSVFYASLYFTYADSFDETSPA
jgi:hypothetical protein